MGEKEGEQTFLLLTLFPSSPPSFPEYCTVSAHRHTGRLQGGNGRGSQRNFPRGCALAIIENFGIKCGGEEGEIISLLIFVFCNHVAKFPDGACSVVSYLIERDIGKSRLLLSYFPRLAPFLSQVQILLPYPTIINYECNPSALESTVRALQPAPGVGMEEEEKDSGHLYPQGRQKLSSR